VKELADEVQVTINNSSAVKKRLSEVEEMGTNQWGFSWQFNHQTCGCDGIYASKYMYINPIAGGMKTHRSQLFLG